MFDEIADNMLIITGSCWVIYSVLLIHKKHEESQSQILTATFESFGASGPRVWIFGRDCGNLGSIIHQWRSASSG